MEQDDRRGLQPSGRALLALLVAVLVVQLYTLYRLAEFEHAEGVHVDYGVSARNAIRDQLDDIERKIDKLGQ